MLAALVKEPFNNPDWVYEVKWDGFRVMAYVNHGTVKLVSRGGQNYTKNYQVIVEELRKLDHDAVIDGELILMDESGKPNFDELQRYTGKYHLIFYAFDLLWLDGKLLTTLSLLERKQMLSFFFASMPSISSSFIFSNSARPSSK